MENSTSSILALENSKLDEQVTLISDLNLIKDDWVIKVCVIRFWGLPDFKNPSQTYQLELVLVDEKGTKIQAVVQKQNLSRFQNLLKEGFSFYIKNFAIGASKNKIKYCNHTYKLNLYYKTSVTKCNTFRGSVYGFDLSSYPLIWARSSLPENVTIDVNGDVVTCGRIEENPDKKGVKLQLEIQDLNGKKLCVTLWDKYAEQMNDYIQNHELHGRVIIILQFANVKWFKERPSISSCYNVSKLFINSEIGEIIDFKNRLVAAQGDDSSHRLSIVSTKSYSISETFLVKNERKDIAELFEIVEQPSTLGMSDTQAKQECLKDAVSYTGDVATPSNFEKSTASSPSEKNKVNKSNDTPVDLKRKLEDVYSQDDNGTPIASIMTIGCTASPPGGKRTSEDVDNDCSVQSSTSKKNRTNAHNLKIPKIEKE